MQVALIEIPVTILEGLVTKNLISKESYTVIEVYEHGMKQQPEYVKIVTSLKIVENDIRDMYKEKNNLLKQLADYDK